MPETRRTATGAPEWRVGDVESVTRSSVDAVAVVVPTSLVGRVRVKPPTHGPTAAALRRRPHARAPFKERRELPEQGTSELFCAPAGACGAAAVDVLFLYAHVQPGPDRRTGPDSTASREKALARALRHAFVGAEGFARGHARPWFLAFPHGTGTDGDWGAYSAIVTRECTRVSGHVSAAILSPPAEPRDCVEARGRKRMHAALRRCVVTSFKPPVPGE